MGLDLLVSSLRYARTSIARYGYLMPDDGPPGVWGEWVWGPD